jgi:hypothetical protein
MVYGIWKKNFYCIFALRAPYIDENTVCDMNCCIYTNLNELIQYLNVKKIEKYYQMKYYREYLLFSKREYIEDNWEWHCFENILIFFIKNTYVRMKKYFNRFSIISIEFSTINLFWQFILNLNKNYLYEYSYF